MASFEDDILQIIEKHYPESIDVSQVVHCFARVMMELTITQPAQAQPVAILKLDDTEIPPLSPSQIMIIQEAENDPEPPRPLEEVLKGFNIQQTQTKKKSAKSRSREELEPDLLNADDDIF